MLDWNHLSAVGLGTWQFSAGIGDLGAFWPALDDELVLSIVKASLSAGVNWFDTAEKYGEGASEKALSNALASLDVAAEEVFIADKWWPKQRKAISLTDSIDQRLACLNGYPISLYQIHWPESNSWLRTEMKYLAQLVETEKVGKVGLCNYNWRQVKRAHGYLKKKGIKLDSVQLRYSLSHRSIETNNMLQLAEDLDIKIIAWSPLDSGLLTGRFHHQPETLVSLSEPRKNMYGITKDGLARSKNLIEKMIQIADKYDATCAQVALRWVTQKYAGRVLVIPGASSPEQAMSNAASMTLNLESDEINELDEISMGLV